MQHLSVFVKQDILCSVEVSCTLLCIVCLFFRMCAENRIVINQKSVKFWRIYEEKSLMTEQEKKSQINMEVSVYQCLKLYRHNFKEELKKKSYNIIDEKQVFLAMQNYSALLKNLGGGSKHIRLIGLV